MVIDQAFTIEGIAPHLLILGAVLSVLIAVTISWISGVQRRTGVASTALSLLVFFGALIVNQLAILNGGLHVESKHAGWISEHSAPGGVTLGFFSDELALIWGFGVVTITALFLVARQERFAIRRVGQEVFSVLWAVSGTILVSFSGTVWTALSSLVFLIVATTTVLSDGWSNRKDSRLLSRELFDRGVCLVISIVGASLMSNYGEQLRFGQIPTEVSISFGSRAGMLLLTMGLIGQLKAFPFSGYLVCSAEDEKGSPHLLVRAILPSVSILIVLIRLAPFVSAYHCSAPASVIAASTALLTFISALSQKEFRPSLGLLIAGGFNIASAMVVGGQVFAGLNMAFGFCLATLCFLFLSNCPGEFEQSPIFKTFIIASGLLSSGMTLGLVGAGLGEWLSSYSPEHVWELAIRLTTYLLYAVAVWRVAFLLKPVRPDKKINWESQVIPGLLVVSSFAIWWLGAPVDPAVFGDSVRLFTSLFERALAPTSRLPEPLVDRSVLEGAQTVISVLSGLLMFWLIRRRKASARTIEVLFPKTISFFRDGYRIDSARLGVIKAFDQIGTKSTEWIDERFWLEIYPRFSMRLVRTLSRSVSRYELLIAEVLEAQVGRVVNVWSKFFQLVQSGDIQWYLFVGLMVAVAMLMRYLGK